MERGGSLPLRKMIVPDSLKDTGLPGKNPWLPMRFRLYWNDQLMRVHVTRSEQVSGFHHAIETDLVVHNPRLFMYRLNIDLDGMPLWEGWSEEWGKVGVEKRDSFFRRQKVEMSEMEYFRQH